MLNLNRSTEGFTILELLVAIALTSLVIILVFTIGSKGTVYQNQTQSGVAAESSLRRVLEIMTQDLRNSAFGLITNLPDTSNNSAISFAQSYDTATFPVTGPTSSFPNSNSTTIMTSGNFNWSSGTKFILVSPTSSQATMLSLSTAASQAAIGQATLTHNANSNTLCSPNTAIVWRIQPVSYKYDPNTQIVYRRTLNNDNSITSIPLALNVSNFTIKYIGSDDTEYNSPDSLPASVSIDRVAVNIGIKQLIGNSNSDRRMSTSYEIPKTYTISTNALKYIAAGTSISC